MIKLKCVNITERLLGVLSSDLEEKWMSSFVLKLIAPYYQIDVIIVAMMKFL